MNEILASFVTIIKKGNLIIVLLSFAISIFVFKINHDFLWAIFTLCITYPLLSALYYIIRVYFYNKSRKAEIEYSNNQQELRNQEINKKEIEHIKDVYNSLPDHIKQSLKDLCRIPKGNGGSCHTRILNMLDNNHIMILFDLEQLLSYHYDLLVIEESVNSVIVKMNPLLHWVIDNEQ
jgi:hypothetical protein